MCFSILNIPNLQTDLIAHYKKLNLDVKVVILRRLSDLRETLTVLRRTTVLVAPPGSLGLLAMFLPYGAVFQTVENPLYWPLGHSLWHRNMGQFWGHVVSMPYNYTEKEKAQSGGLSTNEVDLTLDWDNLAQHLDIALERMADLDGKQPGYLAAWKEVYNRQTLLLSCALLLFCLFCLYKSALVVRKVLHG